MAPVGRCGVRLITRGRCNWTECFPLKATVAAVEIKKPAGKWEKVSGESYSKIEADPETGMPGGLGLGTISGITLLMQSNKDRQMMARMGGMKG